VIKKPNITDQKDRYRFIIYALLAFAHAVCGLNFLGPSAILPLINEEWFMSGPMSGLFVSAMTLTVTFASIPLSIIGSRLGAFRAYLIGWLILGLGVFSYTFESFGMLLGIRFIQGFGASFILPVAASIVMEWAENDEIAAVNTVNLSFLTVGMGISLVIGAPLAELVGWRSVLALDGFLALIGALVWAFLYKSPSKNAGNNANSPVSIRDIVVVFRDRKTWFLSFAVVGPWAQFIALSTWLPTFYLTVKGLELAVAGFATSIFTFAGVPATILGGFITAKSGKRRPILLFTGTFLGLAGFLSVIVPNGIFIYLAVFITGFLQWIYEPAIFTIPMELPDSTPEKSSAIFAAMLTMGNASSFIAPVLVGFLMDLTGSYLPGFVAVFILSYTLLFSAWKLPETGSN
jgi:predicted MFS family arabinose efflux permease